LTDSESAKAFESAHDALGIAQHHDAVSGTENQHTANDYSKRLSNGIIKLTDAVAKSFAHLTNTSAIDISHCQLLNISECLPIEGRRNFTLVAYNPLARDVRAWLRVPLLTSNYRVKLLSQIVDSEIVPVTDETRSIPERAASAMYELVFNAKLPALGFGVYQIEQVDQRLNGNEFL
jgi:lysosomal alpha-mannosidase